MLQTFEQAAFLKIKEHNSCRAVLSDFSAMRRTPFENQCPGSQICVATHFVIRRRRVFVSSFNKIDFDEQEYVPVFVEVLFCALAPRKWLQSIFRVLVHRQIVPAPYTWHLFIFCLLTLLYI